MIYIVTELAHAAANRLYIILNCLKEGSTVSTGNALTYELLG